MKNFKPEVTTKSYKVPLTVEGFLPLSDFDFHSIPYDMDIPTFDDELRKLNCIDVDYNGHFGAAIYFNLEVEDDTPECWKNIERVFDHYIKLAHEWEATEKEKELLDT